MAFFRGILGFVVVVVVLVVIILFIIILILLIIVCCFIVVIVVDLKGLGFLSFGWLFCFLLEGIQVVF